MFENLRRGSEARNFTTILDLKSSSEQIYSKNWRWVPLLGFPKRTSNSSTLINRTMDDYYRAFSLTWPVSMLINWNKRNHLREKELNSQRIFLVHQHGRRFIVLEHRYGRCDVMWKHPIHLIHCCEQRLHFRTVSEVRSSTFRAPANTARCRHGS